jgi:hypothetical protein
MVCAWLASLYWPNYSLLSHGGKTGMNDPIFKSIFGTAWDTLPPVIKMHYANRPFIQETITFEGHLDVSCIKYMRILAPLFWVLGNIPPINENNVPVTVLFESKPDSAEFYLNRTFHFKDRKPHTFNSSMRKIKGNEVVEKMRYGISWRMNYQWRDDKVILSHKGYAINILGVFIHLPVTWLLGCGHAEERAIDNNTFAMCATITNRWLGTVYTYQGQFKAS